MKTAVVALAVLGLLALGLVAVQVTGDGAGGSPDDPPGVLADLEERVNGAKRLRTADVPAGTACLDAANRRLVLAAGASCRFALPARVRRVVLTAAPAGATVRLAISGAKAGSQFATVAGGTHLTVKVYDTDSVLALACGPLTGCQLTLPE